MTIENDVIAVTGSPNTVGKIQFDVLKDHFDTPLMGALVSFEMNVISSNGDQKKMVSIGQINDATTRNRWHENDEFKGYIKQRGELPHLTGDGDVTTGSMQIIGTYEQVDGRWVKNNLSVPCGSGRMIRRVGRATVKELMASETGYSYIGCFYGSNDVPAPIFTKHFGTSKNDDSGAGEAFIGGVFGPSGSGKTVLGLSLATLWARHSKMGFLFLDPQGELASNQVSGGTSFEYDFHHQLQSSSGGRFKPLEDVYSIEQIKLEGVELFLRILKQKKFFDHIGVGSSKVDQVVDTLRQSFEDIKSEGKWKEDVEWEKLDDIIIDVDRFIDDGDGEFSTEVVSLNFKNWLCDVIAGCYSGNVEKKMKEFQSKILKKISIKNAWIETVELFSDKEKIKIKLVNVVKDVLLRGRIIILNLNPAYGQLDDSLRHDIMLLVFKSITSAAQDAYYSKSSVNAMVVLDEAALFIPQYSDDDRIRAISKDLSEKAKMMRKLSVGFLFMTQRISGIKSDIYAQMHFRIYGQGLAIGGDAEAMKNMEGDQAFSLYSMLPSSRLSGKFSYMIAGNLIAMGSSGQPMFIEGYSSGKKLMDENRDFFLPSNIKPVQSLNLSKFSDEMSNLVDPTSRRRR